MPLTSITTQPGSQRPPPPHVYVAPTPPLNNQILSLNNQILELRNIISERDDKIRILKEDLHIIRKKLEDCALELTKRHGYVEELEEQIKRLQEVISKSNTDIITMKLKRIQKIILE